MNSTCNSFKWKFDSRFINYRNKQQQGRTTSTIEVPKFKKSENVKKKKSDRAVSDSIYAAKKNNNNKNNSNDDADSSLSLNDDDDDSLVENPFDVALTDFFHSFR